MLSALSVISGNIQKKFRVYYSIKFLACNFNEIELYNECFSADFYKSCYSTISKGFYNLMSVFAIKNSCYKTFWKTVENPGMDYKFLFLSGFTLWVLQNLYECPFSGTSSWFCFCDDLLSAERKSRKEESSRRK